jgi:hypothetical protein
MNVTLSNDDYAKLAEQARSQGQLTEQLAASLILDGLSR